MVALSRNARVPQQVDTSGADQGEHEFVGTRPDSHAQAFMQFRADQARSCASKLRNSGITDTLNENLTAQTRLAEGTATTLLPSRAGRARGCGSLGGITRRWLSWLLC